MISLLRRREVFAAALALGASAAFAGAPRRASNRWREARARFPQGVASGDPGPDSVILWTRRAPRGAETAATILLEVADDRDFVHTIVSRSVRVGPDADWTARVLVAGLRPSRRYWYRFTDDLGEGSRIGRTCTAPRPDADTAAAFAFVSCQNANLGPLTPWRRMIADDVATDPADQLGFVLHLGDFVYDTMWYPEDRATYFDRTTRGILRYPDGERHDDFHVPTSLADYRALYRAYLLDIDLQDARARWPFVAIWDNGEFSNDGWQGLQRFGPTTTPAQTRKVAANQAWFEYIPSHARTRDGSLTAFAPPKVENRPITQFDRAGLGLEPNNLTAIHSLVGFRPFRWGRHVELLLTDQRSYRSEDYTAHPAAKGLASKRFPQLVPFETLEAIDAGHAAEGGAPAVLMTGDGPIENFRRDAEPRTLLGDEQKAWFLDRLGRSTATWKIWGNTVATLDMRADPQHLPAGLTVPWPGKGYAGFARTDHSTCYAERSEIYDFVASRRIAGFVTLSGDRHSFWAGYAAKALPPARFRPVGIAFVTGSISSPGVAEAFEHNFPKEHPLRALYQVDGKDRPTPETSVNLLLRHGVRTCLDYAAHGDLARAKAVADPGVAPHVQFVDMAGHGYGVVRAAAERIEIEFVCTARPVVPTQAPDGGPLRYRVVHGADRWAGGDAPVLKRAALIGNAELSA
ncbi:alkaline phosphatase D family protein [Sphingomonas sp. ASV193]|uniref:alkaline phosphatase D family protein n=1 Tax=Sphingomonas sp. ASV193 TaxID=3144405 RepID=UPI0032E8AD6B